MINYENVHHRYGDVVALHDLNLEVLPGEIFGLLGPNGAGKTTAIKIAATLLRPASGRVTLDGIDVQADPMGAKQRLGLMPDTPFFYSGLSGRQFLRFVGNIREMPSASLEARIAELMAFFRLEEAADSAILTYSLGMKKKLGLATAILHQPKVLILDEPTSGLDPHASRDARALLVSLRDAGTTVFLTTHVLQIAQTMCDRVGILDRGRLVAVGSLAELRARDQEDLEDVFVRVTQRGPDESDAA
ncbi:MAG: ABC transporter ATP-binding protein [Acidobacteria bacterium]|nr:ABC transporter ATP-binding protein [Acidobacteriota bacterium]